MLRLDLGSGPWPQPALARRVVAPEVVTLSRLALAIMDCSFDSKCGISRRLDLGPLPGPSARSSRRCAGSCALIAPCHALAGMDCSVNYSNLNRFDVAFQVLAKKNSLPSSAVHKRRGIVRRPKAPISSSFRQFRQTRHLTSGEV